MSDQLSSDRIEQLTMALEDATARAEVAEATVARVEALRDRWRTERGWDARGQEADELDAALNGDDAL